MTKFNGIKKVALGTALSGALIVGAGFGTYSWFTSEASVSGSIENGTLVLNADQETLFEDAPRLAPSRSVSDSVTFTNTGTEDMYLRAIWNLSVTGVNGNTPDLSGYTIHATATHNVLGSIHSGPLSAEDVQEWIENNEFFPSENGETRRALQSGETITLDLTLTLNSDAGNEYQGATISGSLELEGKQTDAGAEF